MSLYIFDKDGTLVESKRKWLLLSEPVLSPDEQILRPGVREKIQQLRDQGHAIAIATNLRGIYEGKISMQEGEALVKDCAEKIGGVHGWRICPFYEHAPEMMNGLPNPYRRENDCHKPKPGMLVDLMTSLGYAAEDTWMIGNSWRDRQAAEAAGVHYVPAWKFFTNASLE